MQRLLDQRLLPAQEVYQTLSSYQEVAAAIRTFKAAGKKVYVLSSHSHFYMSGVYDTPYWREHGGVLPGWIIGTTGAIRYALPPGATHAKSRRPFLRICTRPQPTGSPWR